MKIYLCAGNACAEIAKDYLLVICTIEEWDKLSIAEQLDKVREIVAGYNYEVLDTRSLSVN